jgi:glucose/arabinose dehydrogenase
MKNFSLHMIILAIILICLISGCDTTVNPPSDPPEGRLATDLPLESLRLPDGWKIALYAANVENARSMSLSPSGTLFVGTRDKGNVYALRDENKDKVIDTMFTIFSGGNMPNGVAFRNGDLYVAEVNRILKWTEIESKLDNPGEPEVIYDKFPTEKHHGWKFISFGPDGKLYVPVGAPCNICESEDPVFASITRMNPDGSELEIVQNGVRNTVGFTWHPTTGDLWFTDNGRDMLGDDIPACELNRAVRDNMHFGYPYCHQGDLADPEFGKKRACSEFTPPAQKLGPHVAPLGVEFYTGSMFSAARK